MAWQSPTKHAWQEEAGLQPGRASDAARNANVETYDNLDELTYINGAPHLKHRSIEAIYRAMVVDAIYHVGRAPADMSVLDLGAGSGLASTQWFRRKVRLTAVDSSESMLRDLRKKASEFVSRPRTVVADAAEYLRSSPEKFDVVTHVSMLHHIPDYLALLRLSTAHVRDGGCLLTFQDPLRYDTMPRLHHALDRAAYFTWRLGQGNFKRGVKTRLRRLRGIYSTEEAVDFDEYHVVRNGVDSEAVAAELRPHFSEVKVIPYWSTYDPVLQLIGERMRLTSSFGVLASGRRSA